MKIFFATLLLASAQFAAAATSPTFPSDVSAFLDRRESCDHWRGEEGYDKERQADIDWSICQSCPGTDRELAGLKKKYQSNPKILKALAEFEVTIEPADKAAAKKFCSTTRKPDWVEQ